MIAEKLRSMIEKANKANKVVVIGAGKTLTNLMAILRNSGITVHEILDNNTNLEGMVFDGVQVNSFHKLEEGTLYIIDVIDDTVAESMKNQLISIGISSEHIVRYPHTKRITDIDCNDKEAMKKALDDMYYERFERRINWDNPTTYTEIVNVEKVYDNNPIKNMFADKYKVREYVKQLIGDDYLTKYYGAWDDVDEIDFSLLPDRFVLKTNNGSSRNILVTDKNELDINSAKEKLKKWMTSDYWKILLETQYKGIKPKIICEEYLDDIAEGISEYQFFCFGGKPRYIWCVRGSHRPECKAAFYDTEWNKMDFSFGYPIDEEIQQKPKRLGDMLVVAEKLSQGLSHVRVDLYEMPDNRILFGELTMTSWGGMKHFVPEKWDYEFGRLILEAKEKGTA
ncbi:TupA-like ATPgrasp [Butyrivibrio hungatei DSM 14810]|uniref:TupA-like ATPgrasp n=1 Tax=Butyrivibrio hungatei DSM 14810 TaxID=1121132 RepID=A0A1M7RY72_9FIRM|nr:ATP-grasp fold amidoligase family protein [Butyrivibrio hungatei]SHN51084.1 TupA-like ATPgrasp [Butyrivibrio hungatei DSM 14810]